MSGNADPIGKELECPVCFGQMEPPIEMCKNGHNLCSGCKPKLQNCPLCNAEFTNVRNRALEAIADTLPRLCSNSSLGCEVRCNRNEQEAHLKTCRFRGYECLAFKKAGCTWRGNLSELLNHMKKEHSNTPVFEDFPMKVHFFMGVAVNGIRLAKVGKELFWVFLRQDPATRKYFRAVQHIGKPEEAEKFEYSYNLDLKDDNATGIAFKRKVYRDGDDMDQEYEVNSDISNLLGFARQCGADQETLVGLFSIHKV